HHELEVVLLLEPAALGPDLHQGHVRAVVHEQRRVGDAAHRAGHRLPVAIVHGAVAHAVHRHLRLGGEQTHRDLGLVHLQREDHRGLAAVGRGGAPRVHAEGGLAHRGPAREDDHLPAAQALREGGQRGAAGGGAGDRRAPVLGGGARVGSSGSATPVGTPVTGPPRFWVASIVLRVSSITSPSGRKSSLWPRSVTAYTCAWASLMAYSTSPPSEA